MNLRFTYVPVISLLLLSSVPLYMYISGLVLHFPIGKHMDCFYFFAIFSEAAGTFTCRFPW